MSSQYKVDFKALKKKVSIVQVLTHYGVLDGMVRVEDSLSGCCPVCESDNADAFRVSIQKNIWNCFAGCSGGNILDLVSQIEGVSIRNGALKIQEWFEEREAQGEPDDADTSACQETVGHASPDTDDTRPSDARSLVSLNPPLSFTLKSLDPEHPYLEAQGLDRLTIDEFGIGYCAKGIMRDHVAIPIHSIDGQLVAYMGCKVSESDCGVTGKFKFPKNFDRSCELFNLFRASATASDDPLVIVNNPFVCMKLWQAGMRNVVMLLENDISTHHEALLGSTLGRHNRVQLFLDPALCSAEEMRQLTVALAELYYLKTVECPLADRGLDAYSAQELYEFLR